MTKQSNQTLIHFAHANGFPASSYNKMFASLQDAEILALEKYAHNPTFPISREWQGQVDELCDFLSSNAKEPVFGVGHSFGGVITYMSACKRPDLFRGIVLLDPPLITGLTRHVVNILRKTPFFDHVTPAHKAITRCTQWPQGTDLVDYFRNKALFRNMDIECVQDYVNAVIEETDDGYQLGFDHKAEAELFRTIPSNITRFYGQLKVPGLLISGENSQVCTTRLVRPFIKHNNLLHEEIKGCGHMFPLEQPEWVAERINQQISQWQN